MCTRVLAFGDGTLGVKIDRGVLDLLHIGEGTVLEMTIDGTGLIMRPVRDALAQSPHLDSASRPPARVDPVPKEPPPERGKSRVELVVERDGRQLARVPFSRDALVIGRDPRADVSLNDRSLSRRHARIERRGASFWIVDLGSANGTFVNGQRISAPHRLNGGDAVALGQCLVRLDGVEQAAERLPMLTITGPEGTHRFGIVGEDVVIGRDESCDICIRDQNISRRHVRICVEGDTFLVEDLGSQNGTFLRGQRIQETVRLRAGDAVLICGHTIEVGFYAAQPSPAPHEPQSTMLIDRSALARVAYIDGDAQGVDVSIQRFALGPCGDEWSGFRSRTSEHRTFDD